MKIQRWIDDGNWLGVHRGNFRSSSPPIRLFLISTCTMPIISLGAADATYDPTHEDKNNDYDIL